MSENPELPHPDPALRRLNRLVGRWGMEGNGRLRREVRRLEQSGSVVVSA